MKNNLLLVLCILYVQQSIAQYTLIPDPNFEQALIDLNIDSEGVLDGQVLTIDINTISYLDVNDKNIDDLTGIEDFTNLKILFCWGNNLSFLNTSNNFLLEELYCDNNNFNTPLDLLNNSNLRLLTCTVSNLSSLDVSNNLLLEALFCGNEFDLIPVNTITELDVSNNINLKNINVFDLFTLESLDLSNNPNLEIVRAEMAWTPSALTELNLANGNNEILTEVSTLFNQDLLCIEVDNATAATNGDYPYSEWFINEEASFSEDCNLGVEKFLKQKVHIYPNPVKNEFYVESKELILKSIQIYDLIGRLVLVEKERFNLINISSIESGILFVRINTDQGILIKKIVKN